jgi:hypothetical protein
MKDFLQFVGSLGSFAMVLRRQKNMVSFCSVQPAGLFIGCSMVTATLPWCCLPAFAPCSAAGVPLPVATKYLLTIPL